MASVRKEIVVAASVELAWDAMRDIGALHTRLVPGFVVDTKLEPDARIVTFADGRQVRELIVSIDDDARRLVWSAAGNLLTHHNGSAQVLQDSDGRTRIVWITDLLPDAAAATIEQMMDLGMSVMRSTLNHAAEQ